MKKRNRIQCAICGDIIESKSEHDFKECRCLSIFVDGGNEYQRWGGEPNIIIDRTTNTPKYWNSQTKKWDKTSREPYFSKEEQKIINKYVELGRLNPEIKSYIDLMTYIFVKIMFEHPLADGNKRLACKTLLYSCGVNDYLVELICKSLAKEIR